MSVWLLCVLGTIPQDYTIRESVDLVEHNWFYDENARLVFDQVIFYDWTGGDHPYSVVAWRLVKVPGQVPLRDWGLGLYVSEWYEGDSFRRVVSPSCVETWTQYDPELVERQYLPKEKRRELRTPPKRTR